MKDKKKILGALLRKWRKKAGISHYAIVKAEGGSLRIDTLNRIEKGEEVTTSKLLQYLHYAHEKGYDVLSDVWYYKSYHDSSCEENIDISDDNDGLENSLPSIENDNTNNVALDERNTTSDTVNDISKVEKCQPEEGHKLEEPALEEDLPRDGEILDEPSQVKYINRNICPHCATKGSLIQRNGTYGEYIECCNCRHRANGTLVKPRIYQRDKISGLRVQINNGVK